MLWKGFLGSLVAVPGVALAVLLLWWVLEVRDRVGPWPAVGLVLVVLAGWVLGVIGLARNDQGPSAGALAGMLVTWVVLMSVGFGTQDQQVMHERGVTSSGTVVRTHVTSDPMGGTGPSVTAVDVQLDDWSVVRNLATRGEHPALGDRLRVTVDPRGTVAARLGDRPDAAGRVAAFVLLAVMAVFAFLAGALAD